MIKRYLLPILQAVITIGLLWWIFRKPETRADMARALHTADYLWLIPGLLSVGAACLLQTERWRLLLKVQGISLGWFRTLRIYLIGLFFNLFLLGATGGDVIKIFYAMRETASKKSAAFLSVLVDRMMGLLALVAVTAVLCFLRFDELMKKPVLMGSLALIMSVMVGIVIAGFLVDRFHLAHKLPRWMPLHARIIEFASAFSIYTRDMRTMVLTFGLSIPAHLLNFLAFYFAARAFGAFAHASGVLDIFSVLPIINTITALPISLSGVGVREQLFYELFNGLFGTPESVAVMISITGFMMTVFWGIVGGCVYLFYRPSGGIHLQEVKDEVEAVEESIENQA
jgi:uncharacterized protein (TIRG00374 family)